MPRRWRRLMWTHSGSMLAESARRTDRRRQPARRIIFTLDKHGELTWIYK